MSNDKAGLNPLDKISRLAMSQPLVFRLEALEAEVSLAIFNLEQQSIKKIEGLPKTNGLLPRITFAMTNSEITEEKRSLAQDSRKALESRLSLEQLLSLRQLENYGWSLQFIRKPLFQDMVPVVKESNGQTIGILEEDGRLNIDVGLETRKEE